MEFRLVEQRRSAGTAKEGVPQKTIRSGTIPTSLRLFSSCESFA